MSERYLDLHDIAELADITDDSARTYHKRATANRTAGDPRPGDLPEPDVIVGTRKQAMKPGWSPLTIAVWLNARPGRGHAMSSRSARDKIETETIADGLAKLLVMRFGTDYPTVHNDADDPTAYLKYENRQRFTIRFRNAYTEREFNEKRALEVERAYGIPADSYHEEDIDVNFPFDVDSHTGWWDRRGLDHARMWLTTDAVTRIPLGCVPIAIVSSHDRYGRPEYLRLTEEHIGKMVEVVRNHNDQVPFPAA